MMKTIEGYLRLPYHIVLIRDEDENGQAGYVAEVQELPGCLSQGSTFETRCMDGSRWHWKTASRFPDPLRT